MDDVRGQAILTSAYVKGNSACSEVVREAAIDAYGRLIFPSIEREIRAELTEKACDNAIKVFSVNLRQLLMQPPVKGRVTIGLDPRLPHGLQGRPSSMPRVRYSTPASFIPRTVRRACAKPNRRS